MLLKLKFDDLLISKNLTVIYNITFHNNFGTKQQYEELVEYISIQILGKAHQCRRQYRVTIFQEDTKFKVALIHEP